MARIKIEDGDGTERQRMWSLAPEMGQAAAVLARSVYESDLSPRLRELIRMRIAAINDCPV